MMPFKIENVSSFFKIYKKTTLG